jgi:hypothetical protein
VVSGSHLTRNEQVSGSSPLVGSCFPHRQAEYWEYEKLPRPRWESPDTTEVDLECRYPSAVHVMGYSDLSVVRGPEAGPGAGRFQLVSVQPDAG